MRSPFAHLRRLISEVLDLGLRLVTAVEGILRTIPALTEAINVAAVVSSQDTPAGEDPKTAVIERRLEELTVALDQGILRVQRSENRVRAIVQGARKELAEDGFKHPGLEAEASQLRDVDGEGVDADQLPLVPDEVAEPPNTPSSIPGVTAEQLARAWHR